MQVQINTDHNIPGREALATHVSGVVKNALSRFRDRVTRVEVHLGDETGHKGGKNEKRCVMEARLQGRPPVAVSHHAATLHQAIEGAAEKLTKLVESTIERLRDQRSRASAPPPGKG
ncbi:MAG: ribosomal subunit interface protein [Betaproteobacteria bacterium RIFCSPLOWO2_12_FULL_63_13]|nr:MAG: ribosomal subunit interface protein [Betaproteobacteria bacterium RIFCSPLOWO2_02_FULL_63_19]OGA47632.1 MAG: ribosomal subunit interface protein [Betaproteobacteria bacterium RIFCSPLOWO2_12_FULL_63_13]